MGTTTRRFAGMGSTSDMLLRWAISEGLELRRKAMPGGVL